MSTCVYACRGRAVVAPSHYKYCMRGGMLSYPIPPAWSNQKLHTIAITTHTTVIMALLKFMCTFVLAILAILSTGGSLGALAARPVRLHSTDTAALLGERGSRRLVVSPLSTIRRGAHQSTVSKVSRPGASNGTSNPNNPGTKKQPWSATVETRRLNARYDHDSVYVA